MRKSRMNVFALGVVAMTALGMAGCVTIGERGRSPLNSSEIRQLATGEREAESRVADRKAKEAKEQADFWNSRLSYHYQDYDKETVKTFLLYREAWTQTEQAYRLAQKKLECPESIDDAEYDAQVKKNKWFEKLRTAEAAEVDVRMKK